MLATTTSARSVDTTRGGHSTLLNNEWMTRPDDQRFLDLEALYVHVGRRAEGCRQRVVPLRSLDVTDGGHAPLIEMEGAAFDTTHWAFGQMCRQVGAPADYLRGLPVPLATENLRNGIESRPKDVQLYADDDTIRAVTGPKYGRIHDYKVVGAVQNLVANSDVAWKVPGVMNWTTGQYNPDVPVTKDTTTLFASDRDVAMFLCDDQTPIEVGRLANGDPDLMFRGFFLKNSEVGEGSLYIATMYLRGVCANRCLWGVENFREIRLRHTRNAPRRMINEVQPVLDNYRKAGDPMRIVAGVKSAKSQRVIATDPWRDREQAREEQLVFLTKKVGFPEETAKAILAHEAPGTDREQLTNVWDFTNQITSYAQGAKHHDRRLVIEAKASQLLERATANV